MNSEMDRTFMQSANFNGSCKNYNFQSKYFVLCFLFLLRNRLWKHVKAKIRKMCTPVKPSCTI